jgi:hypothetical protein
VDGEQMAHPFAAADIGGGGVEAVVFFREDRGGSIVARRVVAFLLLTILGSTVLVSPRSAPALSSGQVSITAITPFAAVRSTLQRLEARPARRA